jgi:hypothetical protein
MQKQNKRYTNVKGMPAMDHNNTTREFRYQGKSNRMGGEITRSHFSGRNILVKIQ